MKIGRNNPCPCGSGKKYKKCHLFSNQTFEASHFNQLSDEQIRILSNKVLLDREIRIKKLESLGIFIDFVTPVLYKGKKVWALGSRIYPNQPENETFHEFIISVFRQSLGQEWCDEQVKLPESEQHFVFKCFEKHLEWRKKNEISENKHLNRWRAIPDGYSRVLLSLAFDVVSLIHASHLPEVFLKKLKGYKSYQSVRYEIAIAALFARLGYSITFFDEEYEGLTRQSVHSEFSAKNLETNEEITVEVKSKEREGVLHIPGNFNQQKEFRSSVSKLHRNALKKRTPGIPFIIFIDMNLPLSPSNDPNDNVWLSEVTKMRDRAAFSTKGIDSPTNVIIFTNFSYHYGTDRVTKSGEWFLEESVRPETLIKDSKFLDHLIKGLSNYGSVPNLDLEIET